MTKTIETLHRNVAARMGDEITAAGAILQPVDHVGHGVYTLPVLLPGGELIRIEDLDAWGVIVDYPGGGAWRGISFTHPAAEQGESGDEAPVLTGAVDDDVLLEITLAHLRELLARSAQGTLGEYGNKLD